MVQSDFRLRKEEVKPVKDPGNRKVSLGTRVMLVATLLVLIGSVMILIRFSSGRSIDLTGARMNPLNLEDNYTGPDEATGKPGKTPEPDRENPASELPLETVPIVSAVQTAAPVPAATERSFTLTVGGTVAMDGEVRKNSYLSDSKSYDFTDVLSLLKNEIRSDLNVVFLENIISDEEKVSDTVTPSSVARVLKNAGFQLAVCGFANAWAKESSGVSSTRTNLRENGIIPAGIFEPGDRERVSIKEVQGIRVSILAYTDTVSVSTRKKMDKKGESDIVPAAESEKIAADITKARNRGAETVIVLMNWGKVGKTPDKAQKALAQSIADAGADLIIGAGSRVPQAAEYLTALRPDGSETEILCIWSLGTILSGDRSNIRRISGYLLHARIHMTRDGKAAVEQPEYTPLYTWRYRQDGQYYYRCLAANRNPPDGMDNEQIKNMDKAAETTRSVLAGSLLSER